MVSEQSPFRGYRGIEEILSRLRPLAEWMEKFKPSVDTLTLVRRDYDLIARWPKTGKIQGFIYTDTGIYWKGFKLMHDKKRGRYERGE